MQTTRQNVPRHNPPELWFGEQCAHDIRARRISATVRIGWRGERHPKGYNVRERCFIRCKNAAGMDVYTCWVRIKRVVFILFGHLTQFELCGCPRFETQKEALRTHLQSMYGQNIEDDTCVTLITFAYEDAV